MSSERSIPDGNAREHLRQHAIPAIVHPTDFVQFVDCVESMKTMVHNEKTTR